MEINCKYEDNVILYTRCSEDVCVFLLSLPVRGRGLKLFRTNSGMRGFISLPVRGRGLK